MQNANLKTQESDLRIEYCISISFFRELSAAMKMKMGHNVSVKSKLKHPPRAYPGHLTSFPAREGGNLMNLVFPGWGI